MCPQRPSHFTPRSVTMHRLCCAHMYATFFVSTLCHTHVHRGVDSGPVPYMGRSQYSADHSSYSLAGAEGWVREQTGPSPQLLPTGLGPSRLQQLLSEVRCPMWGGGSPLGCRLPGPSPEAPPAPQSAPSSSRAWGSPHSASGPPRTAPGAAHKFPSTHSSLTDFLAKTWGARQLSLALAFASLGAQHERCPMSLGQTAATYISAF